jgi:hypothetical protein
MRLTQLGERCLARVAALLEIGQSSVGNKKNSLFYFVLG